MSKYKLRIQGDETMWTETEDRSIDTAVHSYALDAYYANENPEDVLVIETQNPDGSITEWEVYFEVEVTAYVSKIGD